MSLITDLPAIFDQFSEARQKGFHRDGSQRAGYPAGGNLLHLHAAGDPDGGGCGGGLAVLNVG